MEFPGFLELPEDIKIKILNKCHPVAFYRLRQTCKAVNDFCVKHRDRLNVYCSAEDGYSLQFSNKTPRGCIEIFSTKKEYTINRIRDRDIQRIRKQLTGFAFEKLTIKAKRGAKDKFKLPLMYFFETTAKMTISKLILLEMYADQIDFVLYNNTWKIGSVDIVNPRDGIQNVLQKKIMPLNVIKKNDEENGPDIPLVKEENEPDIPLVKEEEEGSDFPLEENEENAPDIPLVKEEDGADLLLVKNEENVPYTAMLEEKPSRKRKAEDV